jgi:hypothetical protein
MFPAPDDVTVSYLDERANRIVPFTDFDFRSPDGTTYVQYVTALDGAQSEGPFPGTEAEGWVIFVLPEDFDETEVEVRIRYDGTEFTWRLSE